MPVCASTNAAVPDCNAHPVDDAAETLARHLADEAPSAGGRGVVVEEATRGNRAAGGMDRLGREAACLREREIVEAVLVDLSPAALTW